MNVSLGTRGHFRLRQTSCSFVPLRVEFDRPTVTGTVFDGQKALKLVTHCRENEAYEQYTMREYLVYRSNLLTPRSFRARLAKATYVDSASGQPLTTRYGMFLEDDDDVARRMDGRIAELFNASVQGGGRRVADADVSLRVHDRQHRPVDRQAPQRPAGQDRARVLYPVPYDFDLRDSSTPGTRWSTNGSASRRCATVCIGAPVGRAAEWSRAGEDARDQAECWRCMTRCRSGRGVPARRQEVSRGVLCAIARPDRVKQAAPSTGAAGDGM